MPINKQKIISVSIFVTDIICLVLAILVLKNYDGNTYCIILNSLNAYCPLCGGTRALIALLNGKFILAIKYNLSFIAFLLFLIFANIWGILVFSKVKLKAKSIGIALVILFIIVVSYTIIRIILQINGIDIMPK